MTRRAPNLTFGEPSLLALPRVLAGRRRDDRPPAGSRGGRLDGVRFGSGGRDRGLALRLGGGGFPVGIGQWFLAGRSGVGRMPGDATRGAGGRPRRGHIAVRGRPGP